MHRHLLRSVRHFSSSAGAGSRRKFDPTNIIPNQLHHVRICNNTIRDAQQSNLSAEMATLHRHEIAKYIDDCYKTNEGLPGYEQIWGGTIPMFDVWKRGAHPFDSLRAVTAMMPNTPTSMLVRSNSLNSMNAQPADVIDEFVRLSVDAGINVFTNFDANNDVRNHRAVAEAVNKYGQHYQAALSWAVYHPDPTVYNVAWAVNWFREVAKMGAHSLYVKDPSGVLTPEMAGVLAREIKSAFPHLPLAFHTHYQTGYGYMTYLEAVKNGANAVECSLGFPDGAGQPYGLTLLRTFEDFGFQTGNPDRKAWNKINVECKKLRNLYASAQVVRTPDIDVELTGIAGGQRSILDKELIDAGQPHLIPEVDRMVQEVRKEGGIVCQVTPAADSYAREALRRLRGGKLDANFTPGYAAILTGECGSTKEPVVNSQRKNALNERLQRKVKELVTSKSLDRLTSLGITPGLVQLRSIVDNLSDPIVAQQRLAEVEGRIAELATIASKPDLLSALNLKIARVATQVNGKAVKNLDDRLAILKAEVAQLKQELATNKPKVTEEQYTALITGTAPAAQYDAISSQIPSISTAIASGKLKRDDFKQLVSASGVVTCSSLLLIPPSLKQAERDLKALEAVHHLGLLDSPLKAQENILLQACFAQAAIPNLITNFFINYYTGNTRFWKPTYKVEAPKATKAAKEEPFLYRHVHRIVENILRPSKILSDVHTLTEKREVLESRLAVINDPNSPIASRISGETKKNLAIQIDALKQQYESKLSEAQAIIRESIAAHPGRFVSKLPVLTSNGSVEFKDCAGSCIDQEMTQASAALQQLIAAKRI